VSPIGPVGRHQDGPALFQQLLNDVQIIHEEHLILELSKKSPSRMLGFHFVTTPGGFGSLRICAACLGVAAAFDVRDSPSVASVMPRQPKYFSSCASSSS
jgi:hypothetical protein